MSGLCLGDCVSYQRRYRLSNQRIDRLATVDWRLDSLFFETFPTTGVHHGLVVGLLFEDISRKVGNRQVHLNN